MDAKILPGMPIERGSIFGYSFFATKKNKGVTETSLFSGDSVRDAVRDGARGSRPPRVDERLLLTSSKLCSSRLVSMSGAQLLAHHTGEVLAVPPAQGFAPILRLQNFEIGKPQQDFATAAAAQFEMRPASEQEYQSAAALITAPTVATSIPR